MPPSASICTIGADDGWASHPPFPSLGKGRGGEATQFTKDVKAFMGVHALMSTKNTKNAKTKGVKAQHDMRGVHRLCRSSPCLPSSLFPSFGREGDGGMVLVDKAKNA